MTAHTAHNMHQNSLDTYQQDFAKLTKRARLVLQTLHLAKSPKTDRQIMKAMFKLGHIRSLEPNAVRPRITELIKAKQVEEVGSITCPETRKPVRLVWPAGKARS